MRNKDIRDLLGIEFPIIQGAMAQISYHPLVAAVSNAGGLGVIASGGLTAERLREEIVWTKQLTDKPFAVNLMLMMTNVHKLIDVLIEEGVTVVTTGAGTPKPYMSRLKEAGIIVIPVIPSLRLAKKMQEIGADAVVAEGTEAGGHVGEVTSMALWSQVMKSLTIPVIAAGGIADGRGIAAAYALGASGVQIGTAFLATVECPIAESYKKKLIESSETSTVVTGRRLGHPVRVVANEMTERYFALESQNASDEELEKVTTGSLRRAVQEGDIITGSIMAGQIVGMVEDIKSVETLIDQLMKEARAIQIVI